MKRLLLTVLLFGFSHAHAANFECDSVMKNLIDQQFGGCNSETCRLDVGNGRLKTSAARSGANFPKVEMGDGYTSIENLSQSDGKASGRTDIRIDTSVRDQAKLSATFKGADGRVWKQSFSFSTANGCTLNEISRQLASDSDLKVDYDKDFCAAADAAFAQLTDSQQQICQDAMGKLASLYESRQAELKKDGRSFRNAPGFSVSVGAKENKLKLAIDQRDLCVKAFRPFESARSRDFLSRLQEVDKPYVDKRAWPLQKSGAAGTAK